MLSHRALTLSARHASATSSALPAARALYSSAAYLEAAKQRPVFANQSTVGNLKLTSETRLIFQGFTGRQATLDAQQSLEYGTKIVGGVRPNKEGEHLGLPVLPSVRAAMEQLKPDATAVYVAAGGAAGAITEAIEAEVPLVVAVAEHIPLHDMLRIQQVLRTQTKTRLVGANTSGMINPHAKCRIGFPPFNFYKPGNVAIAAKSGTLSYETVAATTRAGLGQSLTIGIGGDPIPGTDFVDCLQVFEEDENTEAIILVGELGGFAEEHAAEWIKDYRRRVANPKPIAALIGGAQAASGRVMGHAGSLSGFGEPTSADKIKALEDAGVTVTDHPAKFGELMTRLLAERPSSATKSSVSGGQQKRSMHTLARRLPGPSSQRSAASPRSSPAAVQRRFLHLTPEQSLAQLESRNIPTTSSPNATQHRFAIALDRKERALRVLTWDSSDSLHGVSYNLSTELTTPSDFESSVKSLLSEAHPSLDTSSSTLLPLFSSLRDLYAEVEANQIQFTLAPPSSPSSSWAVSSVNISLDDSAFKSSKRQAALHEQRRVDLEDAAEVAAEQHSIVYIKLPGGAEASIGTVVNGAGLAMNLVDAMALRGGKCANFLDTGGKATSETVKMSFAAVLKDPRVKVVFVNIFGGLTLGDMIANGILMAYRELNITLPVVVRLRGTNEKEGQKIIADSGLPMHAFDDFEEAAAKAIELAGQTK